MKLIIIELLELIFLKLQFRKEKLLKRLIHKKHFIEESIDKLYDDPIIIEPTERIETVKRPMFSKKKTIEKEFHPEDYYTTMDDGSRRYKCRNLIITNVYQKAHIHIQKAFKLLNTRGEIDFDFITLKDAKVVIEGDGTILLSKSNHGIDDLMIFISSKNRELKFEFYGLNEYDFEFSIQFIEENPIKMINIREPVEEILSNNTEVSTQMTQGIVVLSKVKVREFPDEDSRIIFFLERGDVVERSIADNNGFVFCPAYSGWVNRKHLRRKFL